MVHNKHATLDWMNHENHVEAIYRLLGYKVTHNININGQQADLLCEKVLPGAGKTVLYVECKYTNDDEQNSISKDTVNIFVANFHSLKQAHGWTAGVMVSNKKFTQFAKAAAAAHHDIVLKTIDDLYADLFQIHSYLQSCIVLYENEELFLDYVPLRAKKLNDPSDRPISKDSLYTLFNDWINTPNSPQLCLLGDFGAGKTTFMRLIHYEYAKNFLAGNSERMPLFIQLRDYYDVRDAQELVERFFSYELATKVPYQLFDRFMREGRFLLLLDGFDEMGVVSDANIRRKNYLKLCQLVTPSSKVVITCRPTYFVSNDELLDVFGFYKRQIGFSHHPTRGDKKHIAVYTDLATQLARASQSKRLNNLSCTIERSTKDFEIAQIELFDESEIKTYLESHSKDIIEASEAQLNDKSLFSRICEIYDLEDLAKRPILLKLIVSTLPLIKRDADGKYTVFINNKAQTFDDITPSVLYHVYTEGELTREYEKGEIRWQIDRVERHEIVARLAFHMYQTDSLALDSNTVSAIVSRYFQIDGEKLAQLTTDIRTCSFLLLDRYNSLRFAHKSFMEYYVALHMLNLLLTPRKAKDALNQRILPIEILYFLGDLIGSFYPALIKVLNEVFTSLISEITTYNALNLLNYTRNPRTY